MIPYLAWNAHIDIGAVSGEGLILFTLVFLGVVILVGGISLLAQYWNITRKGKKK